MPAERLTDALFDFAVQANVSISVDAGAGCRGAGNRVLGNYSVKDGLTKLLAGSGCAFRMVDVSTVRVMRLVPEPSPAPSQRRTPPRPAAPPPPTQRQTASDSALSELVVTATRRSALPDSLPLAMSTLSASDLQGSRASGIGDLTGQSAGLTVTNLGPGRDKFIIRGQSDGPLTGHTQAAVGLYVDDVRIAYNNPDPDLSLVDVDRVEILRGPQGSLYGAGSIAGLLRIVTRPPDLEHPSAAVSVTAAGTRGGAGSESLDAVANLPLQTDRLGVRVVFYRDHDGGYFDDVLLHRKNTNYTDRTGGRLAIRYRLSDDWTVNAGLIRQALYSGDSQYAIGGANGLQRAVMLLEPSDNEFTEGYLTVEGDTSLGRFKNAFSLIEHELDSRYDATTAAPLFQPGPVLGPSPYDDANRTELAVDEVSLVSPGGGRLQWLMGGFLAVGRQDGHAAMTTPAPDGSSRLIYSEARRDNTLELALFGEATYELTPKLTATLGARLYGTRVSTNAVTAQPMFHGQAAFKGELWDTGFAPRLALQYQLTGHAMVYAQAAEGYRAGGFNTSGPLGQIFSNAASAPQPYRRFGGDELWMVETGAKARLWRDHVNLRAAVFYSRWSNVQSDLPLRSGLPFTANLGDARNVGVELEAAYSVGGLRLRVNGALDRPELVRLNPGFPTIQHSGLPGVPRTSVGADLRYAQPIGQGLTATFNAQYAYVGVSRLTFDASTAPAQGGFSTGRISLGLSNDHWSVTAFVDNPANSIGNTFAYGNPFTLRRAAQVTPQRPRTAGVELQRAF
ncbi:TonB-dependent receptor [Caulobacter sp. KR2-114]|uniref:TonB-dependent receptor n=1 Tax=Caulobacter sp. KR2-114 TaxID=3400912 RepID=UPI003C034D82